MTVPKAKIAVTIDADVLARVKSAVEAGEARSVSGYVEHVRRQSTRSRSFIRHDAC